MGVGWTFDEGGALIGLGPWKRFFFVDNIHDLESPQTIFENVLVGEPTRITPIYSTPPKYFQSQTAPIPQKATQKISLGPLGPWFAST